jgi:hypothetical protein
MYDFLLLGVIDDDQARSTLDTAARFLGEGKG